MGGGQKAQQPQQAPNPFAKPGMFDKPDNTAMTSAQKPLDDMTAQYIQQLMARNGGNQ